LFVYTVSQNSSPRRVSQREPVVTKLHAWLAEHVDIAAMANQQLPGVNFLHKNTGPKTNWVTLWVRGLIGLWGLCGAGLLAAQEPDLDDGWRLLSRYLYRDAGEVFARAQGADRRLVDFGRAAGLLNEPPVTAGKVRQAETLLQNVIAGGARDEVAAYARYLLARIADMHRNAPVAEVEAAYRALIEQGPAGPATQVAASHLALVLLYQRPDLAVPERLAAAHTLEPVAAAELLPDVAVAFYRTLADAALYYGRVDAQVVDWLRRAHAIGSSDELLQISLSLQIAETARATGRREVAINYYREFLARAVPTDQRYETAKLRLRQVEEGAQ